ncbi:MAG: hypothetical protein JHC30_07190 [Caldisericum sp.]|jgi:hypothetical protein|nr:hypothetical protein [Caldisericum sp.]
MKRKLIIAIVVVFVVIAIFVGFNFFRFRGVSSAEKQRAFSVATSFGEELQELSKNGSISIDSKTIREKFGLLLTQRLLIEWMDDPKDLVALINSTYSPSKIEISSLEKIDTSTIKLKGKILWVNKTNNHLIKKEPVVMLLKRKDPEEQYSLVIDKIWHNEYAFYDGKALLKILEDAFPEMKDIGKYGLPYVEETAELTMDGTKEAIVNMQTGDKFTNYYTVCIFDKGRLKVAPFKNIYGVIQPQYFRRSVTLEDIEDHNIYPHRKVTFDFDYKTYPFIYEYEVTKDDVGRFVEFDVFAYPWDGKEFAYNDIYSNKIKRDPPKNLTRLFTSPNVVEASKVKSKEIKGNFNFISEIYAYRDEIAFISGEDNFDQRHITVYDTNKGKIEYTYEESKGNVISSIQMNDDWIAFLTGKSDIYSMTGTPAYVKAIERKTQKSITLDFETSDSLILSGDSIYTIKRESLGDKILEANLKNRNTTVVYDGIQKINNILLYKPPEKKNYPQGTGSISQICKTKDFILSFITETIKENNSNKIEHLLWMKTLREPTIISLEKLDFPQLTNLTCTEDNNIIFSLFGKTLISPLFAYDHFDILKDIEYSYPYIDIKASNDYIVSIDSTGNIFVLNRDTNKLSVIANAYAKSISLYESKLYYVRNTYSGNNSIIFVDLKDNGF